MTPRMSRQQHDTELRAENSRRAGDIKGYVQEPASIRKNLCVARITAPVAEKAKLAINALGGAKVQEVVSTIYAFPPGWWNARDGASRLPIR